jgi:hypothetical protein
MESALVNTSVRRARPSVSSGRRKARLPNVSMNWAPHFCSLEALGSQPTRVSSFLTALPATSSDAVM